MNKQSDKEGKNRNTTLGAHLWSLNKYKKFSLKKGQHD